MDDLELLREYALRGSEEAFAQLVNRHAAHVHAAASRQMKDPQLAQDVTQAVFVALARKAADIRPGVVLSAWLQRATRFAVLHLARAETRRRTRETAAGLDPTVLPSGIGQDSPEELADFWQRAAPLLDEALACLSSEDRAAIVLRYFEQLSLREVGDRLGRSEEAAKKRVARGLEKLRRQFRRRGLPGATHSLAAVLEAGVVGPLPENLARTCCRVAINPSGPLSPSVAGLSAAILAGADRPPGIPGAWMAAGAGLAFGLIVLLLVSVGGTPMRSLFARLLLVASTIQSGTTAPALPGPTPDPAFHPAISRNGTSLSRLAALPDGRVLVTGQFDLLNDVPVHGMARIQADGTVDATFRSPPRVAEFFGVQTDLKVLVRGPKGIARLGSDGQPEAGFDIAIGAGTTSEGGPGSLNPDRQVQCAVIDSEGRILIAGSFTRVDGQRRVGVARLLPGGALDASFDPGSVLDPSAGDGAAAVPSIQALAVQSDGKVMVTGTFARAGGRVVNSIARLLPDGRLDDSFSAGTGAQRADAASGALEAASIGQIRVLTDGALLVSGDFTRFNGLNRTGLARLHSDGSIDASYQPEANVVPFFGDASLAEMLPDGSAWVAMVAGGALRRLGVKGEIDVSVRPSLSSRALALSVATGADGRIFVGEYIPEIAGSSAVLRRFEPSGTATAGYRVTARTAGRVMALAPLPDGRVLVGGEFGRVNGQSVAGLARLNPAGTVDTSFTTRLKGPASLDGSVVNPTVWHALPQRDGRLLITGYFESVGGVARYSLARLNADGTLDQSYVPAATPLYTATYALQSDDRLIVGDAFMKSVGNVPRRGIARLNSDGTLDATFNPGQGIEFGAQDPYELAALPAITVQDDGRILVAGTIRSVDGVARTNLVRLESNGALDPAYDPGRDIQGALFALALQSQRRLVIGGSFTRVGGLERSALARLREDGSVDASFAPVLAHPADRGRVHVRALLALPDGRIVVGGGFSSINGISRNGIALLHEDGSLDESWDPGRWLVFGAGVGFPEPEDTRMVFAQAADGSLFIGGSLSADGSVGLVRLPPAGSSRLRVARPAMPGQPLVLSLEGDLGREYLIEQSADLSRWSSLMRVVVGTVPFPVTPVTPDEVVGRFYRARAVAP